MDYVENEGNCLKVIEKIRIELQQIEFISSDSSIKERVHKLIELINEETPINKEILTELLKDKIKETRGSNSELNAKFYLLYRKLHENKITFLEAKNCYEMYKSELGYM